MAGATVWKKNFKLHNVAVAIDPFKSMRPSDMPSLATPMVTIVNPRNMEVIDVSLGYKPEGPPAVMIVGKENRDDPTLKIPAAAAGQDRLTSCETQCLALNPDGESDYRKFRQCVLCDPCQSVCEGANPPECVGWDKPAKNKCSGDFKTCEECTASACAIEWKTSVFDSGVCGGKANNCASDLSCIRLNNCISRCFKGSPCENNPCQNDGVCNVLSIDGDYECKCAQGFKGDNCETACPYNCTGKQCGDDGCGGSCGSCKDGISCSPQGQCCPLGMEGDDCKSNIDDCLVKPCKYGTCADELNDYTCTCDSGYHGKNCDTEIGKCVPVKSDTVTCDPLVPDSCNAAAGEACEATYDGNGNPLFKCITGQNTEKAGDACSQNGGPYCGHGTTCIVLDTQDVQAKGICRSYCCDDTICGAGESCKNILEEYGDNISGDWPAPMLGLCLPQ